MDPFRDLSRIVASTTELRWATDDCCHWTSLPRCGRLPEVRHKPAGEPVSPSHPTPLHPSFPSSGPPCPSRYFTPRTTGYLCRSSTIAAAQGKAHSEGPGRGDVGEGQRQTRLNQGGGGRAGREGNDEVSMGARWNHSRAANRRVGCRPGKSRRDIKAQVVDPTQARIAASGWSRGAP